MNKQFYQVGGSLPADSKSYIKREADDKLYHYLKEGKYCYVLNARQVGKSSLRVQTSTKLEEEGYSCVNIDLTSIGSDDITADEWYFSFLLYIIDELELDEDEFADWWDENEKLTVINRFAKTLDRFVLKDGEYNIVIFIDEIDSILGIKKDFSADDFFAVIRTFYNLRSEDKRYNRISFALFGVATPEDLMRDSTRTPFNIASSVKIEQFQLEEAYPLMEGLENQSLNRKDILEKIFEWTSGTPYLTQKILDYIVENPLTRLEDIDEIIDILFIKENFKEINISNIQNRILSNESYSIGMLYLIGKIISDEIILADDSSFEQIYLKLSGLVKEKDGVLVYTNKIYQQLFNQTWLDESMSKIDRPFAKDLQRWIELNRANSALLKGEVLREATEWASKPIDLTSDESEYLRLSIQEEQEFKLEEERKKGQSKVIKLLLVSLLIISLVVIVLVNMYFEKQKSEEEKKKYQLQIELSTANIDERLNNMKIQKPVYFDEDSKYFIPDTMDEEIINSNLKSSYKIKEELLKQNSALIHLIINVRKENFDKQLWLDTLEVMKLKQKERLFKNLKFYGYINHADIAYNNDNVKETMVFYKRAIKVDPEDVSTYQSIIAMYKRLSGQEKERGKKYSKGDTMPEIISFFENISHDNFNACKSLGDIYKFNSNYKEAMTFYQKALSIHQKEIINDDKKRHVYRNILSIYQKTKKYDEAIIYFEELFKKDLKNMNVYQSIGHLYRLQKDYDKALEIYKKVIEVDSKVSQAYTYQYDFASIVYYGSPSLYGDILGIYEETKKYDKAIEYFKEQVEKDSKDIGAYTSLASIYQKSNDYDNALVMYKKIIKINPSVSNLYSNSYQKILSIYQKTKKYDEAIIYFEELFKKDLKNMNVYQSIGHLYRLQKDYDKALEIYKKVIEVDSKISEAYKYQSNYGNNIYYVEDEGLYSDILGIYKETKEYNKAIEYFKEQVQKNSRDVNAYSSLGIIYRSKEDYNNALVMYKKIIEINPSSSNRYINSYQDILSIYQETKEYDKAIEYFKEQVQKNSRDVNAYSSLGIIYRSKEDYNNALVMYKKVIEINPSSSNRYINSYQDILSIYQETKEYNKAIEYFKEQIKKNPEDIVLYQKLGDIYRYTNQNNKALEIYQKIIDINFKNNYARQPIIYDTAQPIIYDTAQPIIYDTAQPIIYDTSKTYIGNSSFINESPYIQIFEMYRKTKKYSEAVQVYQNIIKQHPENMMAYYYIGIAYHKQKKYIKAVKAYKQAIKINPTAKIYHKMGMAYFKNNQFDETIQMYRKAVELNPKNPSFYRDLFKLQRRQKQPIDMKLEDKYREISAQEKPNKRKYSNRKGWIYLGEYFDGKWEEQHFESNEHIEPFSFIDSHQIITSQLSLKDEPYFGNGLSDVIKGDRVKVLKTYNIGTYWWAHVQY
ncbi:MAG: High-affnity carbon uptake protein Hat/HatR [uncultured Sulfurovum sp.]|uniref:beta-lactamase n=1 Tax=uncultured Sulfurovum sp. TaxID=269237 RepID=A0A6S6S1L3_9BACT|nr:MAG: High-affnity carbon uptake protein Hat/HatR [uncultured Sulfurovum sp.]